MSLVITPLDDTFQLDAMPVDVSDTAPIVNSPTDDDDGTPDMKNTPETTVVSGTTSGISKSRAYVCVGILLLINLLNYMDRFTIAGMLSLTLNEN